MEKEEKRKIMIENYQNAYHHGLCNDENLKVLTLNSKTCIDSISMQLIIEDNKVKDAYFDGEACAICTSATSLLLKRIKGKTKDEIKKILKNYHCLIEGEKCNQDVLGTLMVYDDIHLQPGRKECALLPAHLILKYLNEQK